MHSVGASSVVVAIMSNFYHAYQNFVACANGIFTSVTRRECASQIPVETARQRFRKTEMNEHFRCQNALEAANFQRQSQNKCLLIQDVKCATRIQQVSLCFHTVSARQHCKYACICHSPFEVNMKMFAK